MSLIPIDIVNNILLYIEKHPVAKLLCCRLCKDDENCIFPIKYNILTNKMIIDYFLYYVRIVYTIGVNKNILIFS